MLRAGKLSWIGLLAFLFCACVVAFANPAADDDYPDLENSRVARITVVRGDVQIKRAGGDEWEQAAPNVPLIEGDRIATGENSRFEIQFDYANYLRVDEYSILKVVTLRNEGIAVSLPEGSLNLRLGRFDREREYFEIDAPSTTVSVRKEGLYRIDAPRERSESEVRVAVTGGGEARVYTETSGFSIRNGRQATIYTAGNYAGEFDLTAARSIYDDFDRWSAERDDRIARNRANDNRAYYDPAIYGADELYEYGDWVYTDNYGYIWRPHRTVIASYSDWSPYRYGHWRHLPHYGWTWIADEPWGWATSHYGRWVYVGGYWAWCPYDSWRSRRVFWQPALAIIVRVGRSTCWYPMPYNYGYRYGRRGSRTIINNNTTVIINNNPPAQQPRVPLAKQGPDAKHNAEVPVDPQLKDVYAKAVTGVPSEEFGKGRTIRQSPYELSRQVVETPPILDNSQLPQPNKNSDVFINRNRQVIGKRESMNEADRRLENGKIGAMVREKPGALDDKLREERVFRGRMPADRGSEEAPSENGNDRRKTGVFDRNTDVPVFNPGTSGETKDRPTPRRPAGKSDDDTDRPVFNPGKRNDDRDDRPASKRVETPVYRPEKSDDAPVYRPPQRPEKREEPRSEPPPRKREEPRYEPPPQKREEPRYEPPPRKEEPRYEPPPRREEPRYEPPRRPDPPPQKREDPPSPPPSKDDGGGVRRPGKDPQR